MAIGRDIIGNLAKQFGYSKELVREALASNQIDALTASLIGSRIDKLQQTRQEAGARTTVLEDVLAPKPEEMMGQGIAAAPQQAPTALAALPSNLPAQGMAGGGIVAFAEGGDLDLDDDEDEPAEKSTLAKLMGGLSSGVAALRSVVPEGGIPLPQSYEAALAEKGQTPASARKLMIEGPKKGDYVMPPMDKPEKSFRDAYKSGGHKYEADVIKEAERIGLDPKIAVHALYKETGNLRNPETARSRAGAVGIMQLMPRTAKELGVDPFDPEQNIRGGVMYLKKMMDKYNDPTLALAAYNAGPGRVDRALKSGKGIEALPRETRNYVVANRMASGGVVAFQAGGLGGEFGGTDFDTRMPEETVTVPTFETDPITGERLFSGYRNPIEVKKEPRREPFGVTKPKPDTSPLPAMGPTDEELRRYAPSPEEESRIEKLIGGAQGGEKEDGIMKKYMSLLEGREKASADQRKQDAYLSLLSAGLGIMGGTSPFAATNIGQGAQAGVAAQAAARKAQIADEAATLKGFGTAAAAEEYAKQRKLLAAQGQEAKIGNLIANREKQLETAAFNLVTKTGIMVDSAEGQAAIAREVQRLKSADPLLTKLYQQYGLPAIPATTATAAPVDYTKTYGLTPRKSQ
jgi:Transglycosylase SLT domain